MPLDISRIRAICFDVDGTLSDTDDQAVEHLARLMVWLRWLLPRRDPHAFARWAVMAAETPGNLVYSIPDRLGIDAHLDRLANRLARLRPGGRPPSFRLIPGAREVLEHLHPRFPLAVVSARGQVGTHAFLAQFALGDLFRTVVSAHTCRYTKPFPDPILHAAAQMGVAPQEVLMVGDTTVDVRAAKAAGAQAVAVLCGFGEERELVRAGADLILPGTADLLGVLLRDEVLPPAG